MMKMKISLIKTLASFSLFSLFLILGLRAQDSLREEAGAEETRPSASPQAEANLAVENGGNGSVDNSGTLVALEQRRKSQPRTTYQPRRREPPKSKTDLNPAPEGPGQEAEAEKTPPTNAATPVRLQLDHADLNQVINIIGHELKINYVVDPAVKGNATINTTGDLRREDLLPLLETLLNLNGAAIVKTGNLYHIVPGAKVKQLPIPVRTEGQPAEPGKESVMEMQVVPMRFVSAKDMSKILSLYLSEGGNLVTHEGGNLLIITENAANLKRLLELVNIFDSDVFANNRVHLYPVKNNRAKNLISDLENVFAAYGLSKKDSAVRFISIDRINSILAISPNPGSFVEVEKWVQKLDQPVQNVGLKNYVYKIENADAKNIATVLLQIYGQKSETEKQSALALPGSPGSATSEEEKPAAKIIQGEIKIVADEINNALIVQATPQDYEIIKETIKELDRVPRQVLIDAKIYEVTLTGALSMGVSAFLQQRSAQPHLTTASFSADKTGTLQAGLNFSTFALVGQTRELIGFLNAQESRSRTRVLSSPSIIASDNKEARIQVGAEVPILTSQGVVPGGQVGGTSLFSNTIQSRSTGVILHVVPRINSGGWVTLKIQEEVSNPVAPTAGSGIQSPTISVRSVTTQVTVKDGETIALGGIIAENKLLSKNRVPLLGDIPGLGLIFGNTSYTNNRTELIALITPHVIEDINAFADVTDELKSQLKEIKKDLKLDQSN